MVSARISVTRDGRTTVVDVADDLARADVSGRGHEVKVVADTGRRVDLEIDGEPVSVEGWPADCRLPPGPVDVNGESWPVGIEGDRSRPPAASPRAAEPPQDTPRAGEVAVLPPMPGRILEVRVRDGDVVVQGAVLLVLEAMKMRNEVAAPAAGRVRDVRVKEGSNVRAREPMLTIVASTASPP